MHDLLSSYITVGFDWGKPISESNWRRNIISPVASAAATYSDSVDDNVTNFILLDRA